MKQKTKERLHRLFGPFIYGSIITFIPYWVCMLFLGNEADNPIFIVWMIGWGLIIVSLFALCLFISWIVWILEGEEALKETWR